MQHQARIIIDFLAFSERLKRELRHSWLSDGRRESVAEHSWQLALMAILVAPHLRRPVDLLRVLEMIVVHDLTEAVIGDIPAFEVSDRQNAKRQGEAEAAKRIRDSLDVDTGRHVHALFLELETGGTSMPCSWSWRPAARPRRSWSTRSTGWRCRSSTTWLRTRPGSRWSIRWSSPGWRGPAATTRSSLSSPVWWSAMARPSWLRLEWTSRRYGARRRRPDAAART
ncbi:HD domain-containing protein [Thalassobaculum sp.]|uniref:HD domain-containing protein n=1 Tax=Thalassobaculum sp. TaxID=2022740 RepID=UPI003B5B1B48